MHNEGQVGKGGGGEEHRDANHEVAEQVEHQEHEMEIVNVVVIA